MRYFDTKNTIVGLKAIGTSLMTSLIWVVPMLIARYLRNSAEQPVLGLVIGLISLFGYIHTWGYLSKKFWSWK